MSIANCVAFFPKLMWKLLITKGNHNSLVTSGLIYVASVSWFTMTIWWVQMNWQGMSRQMDTAALVKSRGHSLGWWVHTLAYPSVTLIGCGSVQLVLLLNSPLGLCAHCSVEMDGGSIHSPRTVSGGLRAVLDASFGCQGYLSGSVVWGPEKWVFC